MTEPVRPLADDAGLQQRYGELMRENGRAGEHPSEEAWLRFVANELDAAERGRMADHIASCADCAEMFRTVSHVQAGAPAFDPDAPSPFVAVRSERPAWYGLAAAAVLALALGSLVWWQVTRSQVNEPEIAAAPLAPPAPPAIERRPEPRAWAVLPNAPAVSLPVSLSLVVRGASADRDEFMKAFGPAIAPYRQGRYADAATALEPLTRQYPQVAETWFYLGVSHLLAGQPAAAIGPLGRARTSEVVGDEARWLEAVALERAGRPADATAALQAICDAPGPERARACTAAGSSR